eukprot:m.238968 g.238968  ORF g.238968 m.238968 type:complete len:400 (-) comp22180_c0_seq1:72-1271(-)
MAAAKWKWATDFDKHCLIANFEQRGWQRVPAEEEWNFFWASKQTVHRLFDPANGFRFGDLQMINHFPNHWELTRKDTMVKNIKRYRKDLEKEGHPLAERNEQNRFVYLDIVPDTFQLPGDFSVFMEEFKRNPSSTWIVKPSASSQGKGIFIVNKMAQMLKWAKTPAAQRSYVVSRYVDNPLLIGGKKFDLRIYVLVTSYKPLKAYVHRLGFCRFCTAEYAPVSDNPDDLFVHLTNVSFQKQSAEYNEIHGGKWTLENLRCFIEGTRGKAVAEKLFDDINWIFLHALRAVQATIINDRHCFELYGFDILIDSNLKPWLIEINASPSLSATTVSDRLLKATVINDVFNIVFPDGELCDVRVPRPPPESLGGFQVLFDESAAADPAADRDKRAKAKKPVMWR